MAKEISRKQHKTTYSGFTLIELTIAIIFISILFMAVGTTTSGVINAYKKGIAMKLVNNTGRNLMDEFTTTIQESPSPNAETLCARAYNKNDATQQDNYQSCIANNAYKLISQQWYAPISIDGADPLLIPLFGSFCTGKYSYVWNTGYTFQGQNSDYKLASGEESLTDPPFMTYGAGYDHFRLLKFQDSTSSICISSIQNSGETYDDAMTTFINDSPYNALPADGVELLNNKNGKLAIYDFVIYPPIQNSHTKHTLYSASLVLATLSGGINILSSGNYCKPPSELELTSDFSYCAINKFNFAMRSTGV